MSFISSFYIFVRLRMHVKIMAALAQDSHAILLQKIFALLALVLWAVCMYLENVVIC